MHPLDSGSSRTHVCAAGWGGEGCQRRSRQTPSGRRSALGVVQACGRRPSTRRYLSAMSSLHIFTVRIC
eukprot:6008405-Prymnesium_polylepis.1